MAKHLRFSFFLAVFFTAMSANAQNPYLPLWEHIPDGEPRVFEDPDKPGHYRAYIIGSHDVHYTSYCGNDIRMWSAPVEDLTNWRDEGPIFSYFINRFYFNSNFSSNSRYFISNYISFFFT